MISWINKKNLNLENINEKILDCIQTKHFTNNGKNVCQLQQNIKNMFKLDDSKEVLMTCNGAMGLNALIAGYNILHNRTLRWAVQSFTFPCSKQGSLVDSLICDIDENMGPSIRELNENVNDYDGIVVTNCFGASTNIQVYEEFCKKNNKLLIFDNAAAPLTFYKNKNHLNYGDACFVSLHHTKPIGFGEGGFIVFDKKLLENMEKAICFGYTKTDKYSYNIHANNFKMSEVSCIYISDYLTNLDSIYNHHTKMIDYFTSKLNIHGLNDKVKFYANYSNYSESLLSCIPILFSEPIDAKYFTDNNIEAKKYYFPLNESITSCDLFDRIICLPLNMDVTFDTINYYINVINKLFNDDKIICIGLNKTGTTSLTCFMENIGYKSFPEDLFYLNELFRNQIYTNNHEMLIEYIKDNKYNFYEDCPFNIGDTYKLFEKHMPNARFILTWRESGDWYNSLVLWTKYLISNKNYENHDIDDLYIQVYGFNRFEVLDDNNKYLIIQRYNSRNNKIIQHFKNSNKLLILNLHTPDVEKCKLIYDFLNIKDYSLKYENLQYEHKNKNEYRE